MGDVYVAQYDVTITAFSNTNPTLKTVNEFFKTSQKTASYFKFVT